MNIVIWILQFLLAIVFLAHGGFLLFPPAAMVGQLNESLPRWFQLLLGVAEIAAALALTLPGVTRIPRGLVPMAAGGIMIVMAGATVFHIARGEAASAATTFALLLMATFVACMRSLSRWRHDRGRAVMRDDVDA